ncbi:MAG: DUF5009 domain-containing protein [Magnetococcales bacterium]|nr:DUF5009 domain-containing protein [Magnetococcales bacterium]
MTPSPSASIQGYPRIIALDVLRGATVVFMLLVNNPGDWSHVYGPLLHAPWHGWTPTDFIFPFFLWIVGVSAVLSLRRRLQQGVSANDLSLFVLRRVFILLALGLFLSAFPFGLILNHTFSLSSMRFPGVLQRIALCYWAAGWLIIHTNPRTQITIILVLIIGYGLLLTQIPVPGFGAGILLPRGNWAWYVDSSLLSGHTWSGAPVPGFDPEGIVSTFAAVATTLLGGMTGHFLLSSHSQRNKVILMMVGGGGLVALGVILDQWWLPINKNLWTSSYVVFTAGVATVVLALAYGGLDILGIKRWSMLFVYCGQNAIALFVLSGLVGRLLILIKRVSPENKVISLKAFLFQNYFLPYFDPQLASFLFALVFTLLMGLLAFAIYRMNWIIKV